MRQPLSDTAPRQHPAMSAAPILAACVPKALGAFAVAHLLLLLWGRWGGQRRQRGICSRDNKFCVLLFVDAADETLFVVPRSPCANPPLGCVAVMARPLFC